MRSHVGRPLALYVVIASSLVLIATAVPSAEAARKAQVAPCTPRLIDMGTLGGANSGINGSNSVGTWVGGAEDSSGTEIPVLWRNGVMHAIGHAGGLASDVNNRGVVVGNVDAGAFWWNGGSEHLLPTPEGTSGSTARRINEHNDAVGTLSLADGNSSAIEWIHLRTPRLLPTPDGFSSDAFGINNAGDIVGDIGNDSTEIAWEWGHDGSSHALQPEYPNGLGQANLINNRGVAAGGLDFGGQLGLWAATWRHGTVTKLGTFGPEPNFSFAFGQDELGDYVGAGTYSPDDPYLHVFVTRAGSGTMLTMLSLSGNLDDRSNAHAIIPTYMGQPGIAVGGYSTTSSGDTHATVWTCAFRQAFPPPTIATSSRVAGPALSWKRMVDQARP